MAVRVVHILVDLETCNEIFGSRSVVCSVKRLVEALGLLGSEVVTQVRLLEVTGEFQRSHGLSDVGTAVKNPSQGYQCL